jgi:hypothetical protein
VVFVGVERVSTDRIRFKVHGGCLESVCQAFSFHMFHLNILAKGGVDSGRSARRHETRSINGQTRDDLSRWTYPQRSSRCWQTHSLSTRLSVSKQKNESASSKTTNSVSPPPSYRAQISPTNASQISPSSSPPSPSPLPTTVSYDKSVSLPLFETVVLNSSWH